MHTRLRSRQHYQSSLHRSPIDSRVRVASAMPAVNTDFAAITVPRVTARCTSCYAGSSYAIRDHMGKLPGSCAIAFGLVSLCRLARPSGQR